MPKLQSPDPGTSIDDGEDASLEWVIKQGNSYYIRHFCETGEEGFCTTHTDRIGGTWDKGAYCGSCNKEIPQKVLFQLKLLRGW